MENDSKIKQRWRKLLDQISEQAWVQQLKLKWEELDHQSQTYVKIASISILCLFLGIYTLKSLWNVHNLKKELTEKTDLLNLIQSATEERKRLEEIIPGNGTRENEPTTPWAGYFEMVAAKSGIEKTNLTVDAEKQGASTEVSKEALIDLNLKHVNIKQVMQYTFQIETGGRPVKLRSLKIITNPDFTGYMDSVLSVSAFTLKQKEGS